MVDDLWLLSYLSVFKSEVGFDWLTTVSKQESFQQREIKPTAKSAITGSFTVLCIVPESSVNGL